MIWKATLILLVAVCSVASLECYSCRNVSDLSACNITQRCHDGQVCFHNSTTTGRVQVSSLGCTDYKRCGVHGNIPSSIVGREIIARQTPNCLECCSTDQCNRNLCEHLKPSNCIDDESIDCAKLNTLFNICSDIDHAKTVCPKFCDLCNVVDGNWSPWSSWSMCDVTCENGTQTRSRRCNNPAPKYGGHDCQGNSFETKICLRELCPVHGGWGEWEEWRSCSTSCDMGLQSRTRNCSNPVPERNGHQCFGHNHDVKQCMLGPCANGGWSDWGNWNPCSVTCGVGVRSKLRSCTNPRPSPYGQYCVGENFQLQSCATSDCVQSHCTSNPCVNGRCYDVSGDYLCVCFHGYEGQNCNVSSSHCQPNPCMNGTCIDLLNDFSCSCNKGFEGRYCNIFEVSDCYDVLHKRLGRTSGIYNVKLWTSLKHLDVYCDLETSGGGWTVFQHRVNGSVDFYRNFGNYTQGFGSPEGEFWLGLEHIYEMVAQGQSELRIDLMAADGTTAYEVFPNFSLSPGTNYTLHIGKGSGTAGDSGSGLSYHNGYNFYTYDHDDSYACASTQNGHGGWWYHYCAVVNLNGQYVTPGTVQQSYRDGAIIYYEFQSYRSLKHSKMMFRRIGN